VTRRRLASDMVVTAEFLTLVTAAQGATIMPRGDKSKYTPKQIR
jgi:hypothetical protein